MRKLTIIAFLTMLAIPMMALKPWKKGAFETNKYRNLFVEMGYKQADVDAKLKEVFNDVFRGPNKVYFEVGDSIGYVSDIKNHDARTEGMSYGLMIAVQFGEKDIFDRLWRWTKRYMQHQDGIRKGYFAWSCKTDGTRNSDGAASDGELYFITSLIFASNRWGDDTGINYKAEAQNILDCIQPRERASTTRPRRKTYSTAYSPASTHPSPGAALAVSALADSNPPTPNHQHLPPKRCTSSTPKPSSSPSPPTVSDSVSPIPATTFLPSMRYGHAGPTMGAPTSGTSAPQRVASSCTNASTRRRV